MVPNSDELQESFFFFLNTSFFIVLDKPLAVQNLETLPSYFSFFILFTVHFKFISLQF